MYGSGSKAVGFIVFCVLVVLGVVTLFSSMRSVDTGKVGVVTSYGKVTGRELEEGFSWVAPWGINRVTEYDIKTQKEEQSATSATKDQQDATVRIALNYRLERGMVSDMHQKVGKDYVSVIVTPTMQSVLKSITAKYTALEQLTLRDTVESDVQVKLREKLEPRGINVENVAIVDVEYSEEFSKAIEQRQVAEQNAKRAEYNLQQARLDAQSQEVQAQTLTDNYLQMKAIEKWTGEAPKYLGGDSFFGINIK